MKSGFTAGLTRSLRYYGEKRAKSQESKAETKEEKTAADGKAMDK